jgi:hypothetical protein
MGCQACAIAGACADENTACGDSADCQAYVTCYYACGSQACVDDCGTMHPMGAPLFQALAQCVFCDVCYVDCNGDMQGCPPP